MSVDHDEDFRPAVAILLAGLLVPALVVAAADGLVTLYLSPLEFVVAAAATFWVLAWLLIEHLELDRTTFALVSIAFPWPALFAALLGFLLLHQDEQFPQGPLADVFRLLIGGVESFFLYGALFALAGVAAVGASRMVEARAGHDDRVPRGRAIATGLAVAVVAVVLIATGANLAAASAATVTATQPGLDSHDQPAVTVTIEGPPAELRLTVTAPDGSTVTRRLSRAEMGQGPLRVAVPIDADGTASHGSLPALAGPYHVRVVALSGVTVDTATFTAASGTDVSLKDTQVGSGTPAWGAPPDRVIGTARHDTTIGVLLENAGAFHTVVSITVGTPEDRRQVAFSNVVTRPDERLGVVISVPEHVVGSIRGETGGTATIRVHLDDPSDDPVASVDIQLPSA